MPETMGTERVWQAEDEVMIYSRFVWIAWHSSTKPSDDDEK